MTVGLRIRFKNREAIKYLERVNQKAVPKAAMRALNRTRDMARTDMVRAVSKSSKIRQKHVRKRILKRLQRNAKPFRLRAIFAVGTLPINVDRMTGKPRETARGVSINGKVFPSSFRATMHSTNGHEGTFERFGSKRVGWDGKLAQPIRKVKVDLEPHVKAAEPNMFVNARTNFAKRFDHELQREIDKATGVKRVRKSRKRGIAAATPSGGALVPFAAGQALV